MKCIFSAQFKQLIKELSIVTVFIGSLTLIVVFIIAGLGYTSIHWVDFINFVDIYILMGLWIITLDKVLAYSHY